MTKLLLLIALLYCFGMELSKTESDSPPTNPFGFYCVDGVGDYSGIDFKSESETYIPSGDNKRISNSFSPSNIYDTYNADECRRVRRPWNALTSDERHLYIDGILELRSLGELNMNIDELVAIASVHDNPFGSVTHRDSDYLFWHGYLVWELESRIRNLGGKYKCFGIPYWDFSNEYDRNEDEEPYIFETGLGGYGDPNNYYAVNGYSWDVTIAQYWSPIQKDVNCSAKGDECPICSMKRVGDFQEYQGENLNSAQENGAAIINNPSFRDFQRWIVDECGLPHGLDNSYDPIWYLFHSMESYYQAMWVNCNNYDLIDIEELDKYPMAFSSYCDWNPDDPECIGITLDDPLYFGGVLAKRPWSFIHNEKLTIKKLYSLPQWNVIYDLNGDDFFKKSGLHKYCKDKLNEEWFILPTKDNDDGDKYYESKSIFILEHLPFDTSISMVITVVVFIVFGLLILSTFNKKKSKMHHSEYDNYGSISFSNNT